MPMPAAKLITERELKRALAICATRRHSLRDQTILHLSYSAGLRACEIAALRVGDVYAEDGSVKHCVTLSAQQTKGSRARVFYVNQRLQRVLEQYQQQISSRVAGEPLFQTQMRTAFSANTMSQLFLIIYGAAGLEGCSSHSGRRSFITRLAEQGVAVHLLAALAGHRSIQTTQRYITVNEALLARAVELA
jgi:integrase/recombinase XerD